MNKVTIMETCQRARLRVRFCIDDLMLIERQTPTVAHQAVNAVQNARQSLHWAVHTLDSLVERIQSEQPAVAPAPLPAPEAENDLADTLRARQTSILG